MESHTLLSSGGHGCACRTYLVVNETRVLRALSSCGYRGVVQALGARRAGQSGAGFGARRRVESHGDMSGRLRVRGCGFFFFQAEDGIRDLTVTGVQTCALPI